MNIIYPRFKDFLYEINLRLPFSFNKFFTLVDPEVENELENGTFDVIHLTRKIHILETLVRSEADDKKIISFLGNILSPVTYYDEDNNGKLSAIKIHTAFLGDSIELNLQYRILKKIREVRRRKHILMLEESLSILVNIFLDSNALLLE